MSNEKSKHVDNKRPRISSSASSEDVLSEESAAIAELLQRITLIEQEADKRQDRISQLENQLAEAKLEVRHLKTKTEELERSLQFTQTEQADAVERISDCEREQALHDNELIRQEIYNRRWNMIFYKVPESPDEDCIGLIRDVLTNEIKLDSEEVNQFKFCGVHRLGKHSRGRARPIIVRFTCRNDRDKVWRMRHNLKGSNVSIGDDLPKRVQEIRKDILLPAMRKARSLNPRNKASVVGDSLIVNGKRYYHYTIPKRWLDNSNEESREAEEESQDAGTPESQER